MQNRILKTMLLCNLHRLLLFIYKQLNILKLDMYELKIIGKDGNCKLGARFMTCMNLKWPNLCTTTQQTAKNLCNSFQ